MKLKFDTEAFVGGLALTGLVLLVNYTATPWAAPLILLAVILAVAMDPGDETP